MITLTSMNHKKKTGTSLICLVLGLACIAVLPVWMNYDIISMDGAFQYVPSAALFLQGDVMGALARPQLPLFPFLMASLSWVTGADLELSGRLISAASFIIACLGLFKLSELLFQNRWIALISVVFLISNRELLGRSVDCLKESLQICFVIWGNYYILRGIDREDTRRKTHISLGTVLLILGTLVRTTTAFFLLAWLAIWTFRKRQGLIGRIIILVSPLLVLALLVVFYPDLKMFKRKGLAVVYLVSQWSGFWPMMKGSMDFLRDFFATGNYLAVLFGFHTLYSIKKDLYPIHVCIVLVLFFIVLSVLGWTSGRYILAPVIWLYPLAAYGVYETVNRGRKAFKVLAVITLISCPVLWLDKAIQQPDPDKVARKDAGQWILAQAGPHQEIATNRERLIFYAQGRMVALKSLKADEEIKKIIAVDTMHEGGTEVADQLLKRGIEPDMRFRSIAVYMQQIPGA